MSNYPPRRSSRAITTNPPQQYNQFVPAANQQQGTPAYSTGFATAKPAQPQQQQVVPPPPPPAFAGAPALQKPAEQPGDVKPEAADPTDVSATTKALAAMDEEDGKEKRWKKAVRAPAHIRRKRMNKILAKVASPKSAIMFLHEMKPGCTYSLTQTSANPCITFHAVVSHDGITLGSGNGNSKSAAKASAAEDAIKNHVSRIVQARKSENGASNAAEGSGDGESEAMDTSEEKEDVPWSGLAAFAMFKLFNEWHQQGIEIPVKGPNDIIKPAKKPDAVEGAEKKPPKPAPVLPANPLELHPCELLNRMIPELQVIELERKMDPPHSVTVAYTINGQQYPGTSSNKKAARKEAAKSACAALFGVIYP